MITAHGEDAWDYYAGGAKIKIDHTPYVSLQNIIVMQPHDYLPNGEQDECDGCPNKTYWNGRLVSECRKEDYSLYGRPLATVRKKSEDDEIFSKVRKSKLSDSSHIAQAILDTS